MIKKILAILMWLASCHAYADTVKQSLATFMQENEIPGMAVAIYINGKSETYYLGYADKSKKTPITKDTIFEVASITKLMTSLLLAQEVDKAKVQLDNSVTDYIPNLSSQYEDITLGNLATHTAGLPLNGMNRKYSVDADWAYSNLGMGLLGEALEKIEHKPIDQLYRVNILSPLKMTSSGRMLTAKNKKFLAQGYNAEGEPVKPMALGSYFPAAAGMKLSASDAQRFLAAAIGLPGTPEHLFYQMRSTQASYVKLSDRDQGLGWEIHSLAPNQIDALLVEPEKIILGPLPVQEWYEKPKFDGDALIDKTGSAEGFRAYIAVIPNKQSGIVVLANRVVSNSELVNMARELLFKQTKIIPNED